MCVGVSLSCLHIQPLGAFSFSQELIQVLAGCGMFILPVCILFSVGCSKLSLCQHLAPLRCPRLAVLASPRGRDCLPPPSQPQQDAGPKA